MHVPHFKIASDAPDAYMYACMDIFKNTHTSEPIIYSPWFYGTMGGSRGGGVSRGSGTPFLAHDVCFLTLG